MDYQKAITDERALRMWAIEQAGGDVEKARRIEDYAKGGDKSPPPPHN